MHTVLPRKMGFDCVTVKSTKTESNPVYDIYRIQEYVWFGALKKIKVTALYGCESDIQCRYFYDIIWI